MTRVTARRICLLIVAATWADFLGAAQADRPGGEAPPIVVRRMFAPADVSINLWPFPGVRYFPMDSATFETLWKNSQQSVGRGATAQGAALEKLTLVGRLEASLRLSGTAELTVRTVESSPSRTPLKPLSPAVVRPRWKEGERPAVLGTGPDGTPFLTVEKSGTLQFDWSLSTAADPSGVVTAELGLPPAAAVSLELDVPVNYDLYADGAVVVGPPAPPKSPVAADRRWMLRLAGGSHHLEFRPLRGGSSVMVQPTVRQSAVYELSERGVEAAIELRIDALSPLERFDVRLDGDLTLIDVRSSDKALAWTTSTTGGRHYASIELDRPLHGANRSIFIRAIAVSTVGARKRLPILRTEGLFWQRGSLTLVTPAPLRMDRLDVVDGLAASPIPLTGGRIGEAVEIQCFSPDTTADVLLSRPPPSVEQTSVAVVDVKQNELSLQHRSQLRVTMGEVFSLEADVPSRWIVDSVTTVPPAALEYWRIADEPDKRQRLSLRFARAITPERPLRLVITAHAKQSVVARPFERADLTMLSFFGVRDSAPLAAVRTESALRREIEFDDELAAPTAATLDPLRRELLAEYAAEPLLDLGDAASPWRIRFSRRAPKYDARIEQVVTADSAGLAERYRIEVLNQESLPLERLVIRLRPAKASPPRWTLDDERRGRVEARRIVQAGDDPADDSELWQIDLRRPATEDVVLHVERATPWADDAGEVSFAAVVDAFEQTGSLVVESAPTLPLQLRPRALTPVPVNSVDDAAQAAVRGSYRFDPKEASNRDALSMSIVRAASALPMSVARVWNRRVASHLESAGRLVQRTRFFVHSVGDGSCNLTFPEFAGDVAVRLDGVPVDAIAGKPVVVRFPADRSTFVIDAAYSRVILASGALRAAELPLVGVDIPVLHTTHQLLVPLAYDVPVDSRLHSLADDSQADLVRRLAGPWAKLSPDGRGFTSSASSDAQGVAEIGGALRAIGATAAAARREGRRLTWESLWTEVQRLRTAEMPPIRFDAAPLWVAEIGPQDPVPISAAVPGVAAAETGEAALRDLGDQVLARAGLKLTADQGAIVVTASLFVESRAGALRVFRPQADAADIEPSRQSIDFDAWRREPASPWRHALPDDEAERFTGGAGHVVSLPPATEAVWLVRREVPATIAFGVVLIAFALGRKLAARRRGGLVFLLAVSAAVACLTPAWIGVVATSTLIGLASALSVEIVLPQRRAGRAGGAVGLGVLLSAKTSPEPNLKRATVGGLVLLVAVSAPAAAPAQPPVNSSQPSANSSQPPANSSPPPAALSSPPSVVATQPATYDVFIPVDDKQKPVGKTYYVPDALRQLLTDRAAPAAPAASQPVLWLAAEYRATLARDIGRTRFVAVEVRATFKVDVPTANTVLRLPLSGFDVASLKPVLVDGRLVDVRKVAGGFELTVPQPGKITLEFVFRPDSPTTQGRSGFRLDIPPALDAQLRVAIPAELASIDVAEAAEPVVYSDDPRLATVRLSPASKLTVRWDDQRSGAEPSVVAEQLSWLKIRPGSTVVDARFRLRPTRPMSELVLVADPRLQWLPKFGGKTPIDDVRSTPVVVGQATVAERVTVVFAKPITEEALVDVSFLVTGASGTGRLRLPELKPAVEIPQRRYFAYSVDPQLESVVTGAAALPAVAVPEFAKAWGESEGALPQAAYVLDGAPIDWTLSTRPALPRLRAAWRQTLLCGRRRIDVAWEAETIVERGLITRYELPVPAEVTVTSVEAAEVDGDSGQVLRWSRDDQGTIVAFLRAPLGGKQKLSLRGHVAVSHDGSTPIPIISVRADAYGERLLQIVRLPDARVTLEKPADLAPYVAPVVDDRLSTSGRPIAMLQVSGPRPAGRLRIQANVDRFKVRAAVTLVVNDPTDWDYELSAIIETVQGLVDEVHLELPPQVALPLAVTPAMPHEVVPGAAGAPRRVILRPRTAVEGRFTFAIKAPLAVDPSIAAIPLTRIRGADSEEYFFRLPSTVGVHVARWDTVQLAPAVLPDDLVAAPVAAEFVVLRSVGPRPAARLHILAGAQGLPYVRYADHRLSPEEDGYFGVSSYLVEPAGLKWFMLRVPPSLEIVQATSGGATASLLPAGDSLWKIAPASDEMPHFIDVAYRSRTGWAANQSFATLAVPKPEGIRTNRAFWAIVEPDALRLSPVDEQPLDRQGLLRERIRLLDVVVDDLANRGGRKSTDDWSAPLARRRSRDLEELVRILPEPDPALVDRASAGAGPPGKNLAGLFEGSVSPYSRTVSTATGDLSELTFRIESTSRSPIGRWPIAAACLLCGLLWYLFRAVDGPMRWPHLVGVLAGAAWLAWLRPAELGWLIILAVLATRLHSAIRQARTEGPATVRPLTVGR